MIKIVANSSKGPSAEDISDGVFTIWNEMDPPGPFDLSSDADTPDIDGDFNLIWTTSEGADNYSVYVYESYITRINDSLTLLEYQTAVSPHSITGLPDGVYYYIVVAYNANGYTQSNCIAITVEIPPEEPTTPPPSIPGYDTFLIIAIVGICSILVYYCKRRNMNK